MFKLLVTVAALVSATKGFVPQPYQPRILGGTNTTSEKYPFYATVEHVGIAKCGASLIKEDAALTTANCIYFQRVEYTIVRAGSETSLSGGQVRTATGFCMHPEFEFLGNRDYDVAVISLDRPFELGPRVQLVSLQTPNMDVPSGKLATLVGIGSSGWGDPTNPSLQEVTLPRVRDIDCAAAHPENELTDRMFCAGHKSGEKDGCGDEGSPLVYGGKQVGIDLWGYACGEPNRPRVFVRVYDEEIHNHIQQCISPCTCRSTRFQ